MSTPTYGEVLEQVVRLTTEDQERLLLSLAELVGKRISAASALNTARAVKPAPAVGGESRASLPREAASASRTAARSRALALAGAWSDLNWDEMEADLDRIRHQTPPSPPFTE